MSRIDPATQRERNRIRLLALLMAVRVGVQLAVLIGAGYLLVIDWPGQRMSPGWISALSGLLAVQFGLGTAFDWISGSKRRAPIQGAAALLAAAVAVWAWVALGE